jgi:hypothetical protein
VGALGLAATELTETTIDKHISVANKITVSFFFEFSIFIFSSKIFFNLKRLLYYRVLLLK